MKSANVFVLAASLTACAGTVSREVSEANMDPSFQYDGVYAATVKDWGGRQLIDKEQVVHLTPVFSKAL